MELPDEREGAPDMLGEAGRLDSCNEPRRVLYQDEIEVQMTRAVLDD